MILVKVDRDRDWRPHFVTALVYAQDGVLVMCCSLVAFGRAILFGRFGACAIDNNGKIGRES